MDQDKETVQKREKHWSELDDAGKIERLRNEIRLMRTLKDRISKIEQNLSVHVHKDGKIYTPISKRVVNVSRGVAFFDLCDKCKGKTRI